MTVPRMTAWNGGIFAGEIVHDEGEAHNDGSIGDEDELDVGVGIHVGVNEARQAGVLLPENDPVASEDQQEDKKSRRPDNGAKVAHDLEHTRGGFVAGFSGIAKEKKDKKKHGENAERGNSKNSFESKVRVRPICDEGAGGAADVHHGVVDGIAERANIRLGSASGSADDAWLYQRDAKRGKNQDDADK